MSNNTMKVRVTLSVEVDVDEYRENYGIESREQIRNDVKFAVLTAVTSGGVLADGIINADLKE